MRRKGGNRYKQATPARPLRVRLVPVLALLALAGGGIGVYYTQPWQWPLAEQLGHYPFRKVKVASTFHHLDAATIRHLVAPYARKGFFLTDVGEIQEVLLKQPWVADAAVRREWPDILNITVVEETAVARWGAGGCLNAQGQVFTPAQIPDHPALPRLSGPRGSSATVLAKYRAISTQLQPLGLAVKALSLDERRSWQLDLDNGIHLALGKEQDETRIRRFTRVYEKLLQGGEKREIAEVDLRYANGFVVRWRDAGRDDSAAHMG